MKKEGRKEGRREDVSVLVDDCGGGRKGDRRGEMLPLRPRPCFAVFVYYLYCKIMEVTTTCSSIMAFAAPIIRYGMASVSNDFTESDPRFHIKCNSSFADKECKRSSVIFDTGLICHQI